MTPDYQAIGERVKAVRLARGITREQLARMIGCSVSFLGHIERGTRVMSIETLCKLSDALMISTDCLLGYWDAKNTPT
jgi:transcriptional regulator with XRE-family HTH domain